MPRPGSRKVLRPGIDTRLQSRRELLRRLFWSLGGVSVPAWCLGSDRAAASPAMTTRSLANLGPLGPADENGLRLPADVRSRVVAVSGERPTPRASVPWHEQPDGAAVFASSDGGWIYASNSEAMTDGGASALRFDARGEVTGCERVLSNTRRNCAGGATPWNTWLSCEEVDDGRVWECDPEGRTDARSMPALGLFSHEAVAVQAATRTIYLTEDEPDSRFYRFVCSAEDWPSGGRAAFRQGRLQAMRVLGDPSAALKRPQPVQWVDVEHPERPQKSARLTQTSAFAGGEGLWLHGSLAYFSTKRDNRIWVHDTQAQTLEVIYDLRTASDASRILSGVDNLTGTATGEILVAEDGGDMQLCLILPDRSVRPLLQLIGQPASEITGPAFSPDGRRLYFSSQRGARRGHGAGITYELQLPFAV